MANLPHPHSIVNLFYLNLFGSKFHIIHFKPDFETVQYGEHASNLRIWEVEAGEEVLVI